MRPGSRGGGRGSPAALAAPAAPAPRALPWAAAGAESLPPGGLLLRRVGSAVPGSSGSEADAPEVSRPPAPAGQTSLPDAAVERAGTPNPSGLEAPRGPCNFPERKAGWAGSGGRGGLACERTVGVAAPQAGPRPPIGSPISQLRARREWAVGAEPRTPGGEGAEHRPRCWSPWRGNPIPSRSPSRTEPRDPPLSAIDRHQRPEPGAVTLGLAAGGVGPQARADCSPALRVPPPALPSKPPALLPLFLLWSWGVTPPQVFLFSDCTVWPVCPISQGPSRALLLGGGVSPGSDCPGLSGNFPRSVGWWGAESVCEPPERVGV